MGMSPKDVNLLEQAAQDLREQVVPALKTFFEGMIENGFTREEAFTLTRDFFKMSSGRG